MNPLLARFVDCVLDERSCHALLTMSGRNGELLELVEAPRQTERVFGTFAKDADAWRSSTKAVQVGEQIDVTFFGRANGDAHWRVDGATSAAVEECRAVHRTDR